MAAGGKTSSPFATFLIIGPVCFFLGILFASFPYDYYVLWSSPPGTLPPFPSAFPDPSTLTSSSAATNITALREPYLNLLEHHIKFLHASPPLISRILHIAIGTGIIGLLAKLYKPTEANMLFDGASLVLYMVGITVYITNLVKGMRVVTQGTYGQVGADLAARRYVGENEKMAAEAAGVGQGAGAAAVDDATKPGSGLTLIGREDSLKVLAASNTILALVLVGVLVLQAGQWYAQKKEAAEIAEMDRVAEVKKAERESAKGGSGNAVSTGVSAEAPGSGSKKRK